MRRTIWGGAVVGGMLAAGVAGAGEAVPYEVAHDQPARVATDQLHAPVRLTAADGVIDSGESWGHSGPWVADVDGDGRRDLIVGDFSGVFRLYRNEGSDREPRYARGVNLRAGDAEAKVPIY